MKYYDVKIEIPIHSRIKYEMDKKTGEIRVDRYLKTPIPYPFNYGYFPNTLAKDNDPLDAILLISEPLVPGCIIECEIIGGIEMIDGNQEDHKIYVIPKKSMGFKCEHMVKNNIICSQFEKEIRFFLESYKTLENKTVKLGKSLTKEESIKIYQDSLL